MVLMRASRTLSLATAACALLGLAALTSASACLGATGVDSLPPIDSVLVPINQLILGNYLGFSGGLYGGANAPPLIHSTEGAARANAIAPRDTAGSPNAGGKYVLLGIGPTNAALEFCSASGYTPCTDSSFIGQAAKDPSVNHTTLAIVNGAAPNQFADAWESPTGVNYDRIRDSVLAPAGLSEKQVEIVWLNVYDANPTTSLPAPDADAFILLGRMGNIARALKARYPKLTMLFLSSRIWAGYAVTTVNPEPYAYESGFSAKWLIQAQINQMSEGLPPDSAAGDLSYTTVAPWIGWGLGLYLWAYGDQARSDGLQWFPLDFQQNDGTEPSQAGVLKAGQMLLGFFEQDPRAACWFATGGTCHK
jgi:hypothetical protein